MKAIAIRLRRRLAHSAYYPLCALLLGLLAWGIKQPLPTIAQIAPETISSITTIQTEGTLVVAENGDGADNHFVLSLTAEKKIRISQQVVESVHASSETLSTVDQLNTATFEVAASSVSGALVINGKGGDDLLTVDLRNGSPIPDGGLIFNGGGQQPTGNGDALEIIGGSAEKVIHRFVNANDGSIEIVGLSDADHMTTESEAAPLITYTGLEPITDNVNVIDRVFSFTGGSETIVLNSGGDVNDGSLFIDSTLGESVSFNSPSASLTIRTDQGDGVDTVQISGLDNGFNADITVTADDDDNVQFTTSGTDAGSGAVQVDANLITVDASLSSTGAIQLTASDAISVSGGGITGGGDIFLSAATDITVSGATGVNSQSGSGAIRFDAGGAITLTEAGVQGASTIDLLAVDNMTLSQVWSFSTVTNTIELTSTNGGLLDGSDTATDISAPAGSILVRAAEGVGATDGLGSDARLEIHGGSLDIVAGSDIDLINSGSIAGLNLDAGTGNIELFAFGVITDTDSDVDIAGNRAAIIGSGALGSPDSPIEMALNELEIDTSSDAGSHHLQETDSVTVTTLTADNGNVFLYGGTFLVQGEIQNPVELNGGSLGGVGQVADSVTSAVGGGTITPGFSPGILTIDGDLTLNSNSIFAAELNQPTAGSGYDQVQVTGLSRSVALGNAALAISLGADYVHDALDVFILIENETTTSTVGGTFNGLPEGAIIRLPGAAFAITYIGGDGNDVALDSIPLYTVGAFSGGTGGGSIDIAPVTSDGVYLPGAVVTLTATSLVTSTFDGWSGDAVGIANPLTITMDADKSVTALFNTIVYTLTTNDTGRGSGLVELTPPGGVYEIGTQVRAEAIPGANAFFADWAGDASGQTNPITLTMTANQEITATFKIPTYTISIANTGDGLGTVALDPPGNVYDVTTIVSATATAEEGSIFRGWSGALSGLTNPAAFSVSADATLTATFELIPTYTMTVEVTGDGAGDVALEPPGGTYDEGTVVTITATADAGSIFNGWDGLLNGSDSLITTTVNADGIITATFSQIPSYTLTVQTVGDGAGSVVLDPLGGTYEEGTVITLTATPESGSLFGGWSGVFSGADNPFTTTVNADGVITATFNQIPVYTLSLETLGDGTGSVTLDPPGGSYEEGTVVTLTAMPESGSNFGGWDGSAGENASASLVLTMDGEKSVSATFNAIPPEALTLSVSTVGSGFGGIKLEPTGGIYVLGTEVTITAVPANDSLFQEWQGAVSTSKNPIVVTMEQNLELIGIFGLRPSNEIKVLLPFIQP